MATSAYTEKLFTQKDREELKTLGLSTIYELETDRGILASDSSSLFGCIFGRDSLITALNLMHAHEKGSTVSLSLVKKILLNLLSLQGKEVNIESGEEPGKCI